MKLVRVIFIVCILFTGCNKEDVPVVTTADVTTITQTSAICRGDVISEGDSKIIAKGSCWSISDNPTVKDSTSVDSFGLGSFTSNLTKLNPGTAYFVRAYATNCYGTGYGNTVSFTTEPPTIPGVTLWNIDPVTLTSATINGGKIISDGGLQIIDRGFCWNTIGYPTLSDNVISFVAGTDTFSTTITGLEPNTCYYVRAYATNLVGTGYSYDMIFPTLFPETPVYPADSIFGSWKLIYSVGGIGGGINPLYDYIFIDEYKKDSVFIENHNGVKYRECKFSMKTNVLKFSDSEYFSRIEIRGDNLHIYVIDTLDYVTPDDFIGSHYYKRLK